MQQPRRLRLAVTLALITTALAACHKDDSATGDAAKEAMGLYAKGFNLMLRDPHEMIRTYFQTIPEDGPLAGSKPSLFPAQNSAARSIKEAGEAFAAAKDVAPKPLAELAGASDRVLAAAATLSGAFTDAQKYYEAENYKDDQFTKGKQLHTAMRAATKDFDAAMATLESGLSGIEDAQAAADLKDREGDKSYGYWFRYYNIEAKKFLHAASDPKQLDAAYTAIRAAHEALVAFVKSKGGPPDSGFAPYMSSADTFDAACTKLVREAKGVKSETGDVDQGLTSAYNALIQSGNFLYQLESTNSLK